jgi:hypothetical protein
MSDVTDQYAVVKQTSFVVPGSRSLNKVHLRKNLQFFEVPEGGIESIRSNLTMKIYDEYSDLLRGMYIARFNGNVSDRGASTQVQSQSPATPLLPSFAPSNPDTQTKLGNENAPVMKGKRRSQLS